MVIIKGSGVFLVVLIFHCCDASSILGVPPWLDSLYVETDDFTCLDGSARFPFSQVNDDYCDCDDGSDEPGTSACNNSRFYCANLGHTASQIPSSWVNDGVCDCCDGSDELGADGSGCVDNCVRLGAEARERDRHLYEMREKGVQLRQQMVQQAHQKLQQTQDELQTVQNQLGEAEEDSKLKELAKNEAEQLERQLLEQYRQSDEQQQQQEEQEEQQQEQLEPRQTAEDVFTRLDQNGDGLLTVQELSNEQHLDWNNDGQVTPQEVQLVLKQRPEVSRQEFIDEIWPLVAYLFTDNANAASNDDNTGAAGTDKFDDNTLWRNQIPSYENLEPSSDSDMAESSGEVVSRSDAAASTDETIGQYDDHEVYLPEQEAADEDDSEREDTDAEDEEEGEVQEVTAAEPVYDAETQQAVDAANEARDQLAAAVRSVEELKVRAAQLRALLDIEFGSDSVFAALHKHCAVHHTHEYEYSLCLFDQAVQKPKQGGVATVLGRWGRWTSDTGAQSLTHLYDNGQQCWNGPKRSTTVVIQCGVETVLREVSEPSKCEYHMTLDTPAACAQPAAAAGQTGNFHEEL